MIIAHFMLTSKSSLYLGNGVAVLQLTQYGPLVQTKTGNRRKMEKVYSLSGSKKVKALEAELVKELKELNDEIEDADNLFAQGSKPFR